MGNTELIAFHLPQYHAFPENDFWWGKDFTEWTNVKKALPLYDGHYQPRIPRENNYYSLDNLSAIIRQMELADKFGVSGFCFYHYWFDGKLLMQKPVEALRDYKGDKLNYCLCWANESWTRAWDGNTSEILMRQTYGYRGEWERHFKYLLTFFEDDSYIKVDNMPLFILYRAMDIPEVDRMIECFDILARVAGFDGIYIVEELNTYQARPVSRFSKAVLEFEPMYTTNHDRSFLDKVKDKAALVKFNLRNKTACDHVYDYDRVWHNILSRKNKWMDRKVFKCAFTDWDNTPRRGRRATFYRGSTPVGFERYICLLADQAKETGSRFVFINAWNEWGEGAYLEPDERNGYGYLEAVRRAGL